MVVPTESNNPNEIALFFGTVALLLVGGLLFRYDAQAAGFYFTMVFFTVGGLYIYGSIDPSAPIGFLHDPNEAPARSPETQQWRASLSFFVAALALIGVVLRLKFRYAEPSKQ